MPQIFPFKALRPNPDFISLVTAKSTDFPNQEDLVHEIRTNSFTFHHVTKSHLSYSGAFQEPEKFLPFAAKYIKDMKAKGVFIKEDKDSFYIYEQIRKAYLFNKDPADIVWANYSMKLLGYLLQKYTDERVFKKDF